jgi:hypothetical protein
VALAALRCGSAARVPVRLQRKVQLAQKSGIASSAQRMYGVSGCVVTMQSAVRFGAAGIERTRVCGWGLWAVCSSRPSLQPRLLPQPCMHSRSPLTLKQPHRQPLRNHGAFPAPWSPVPCHALLLLPLTKSVSLCACLGLRLFNSPDFATLQTCLRTCHHISEHSLAASKSARRPPAA